MKLWIWGLSLMLAGGWSLACDGPASPVIPAENTSAIQATASVTAGSPSGQVNEAFPFKRILCFGDSLTLGVTSRVPPTTGGWPVLTMVEGYVPKLARLLTEEFGEGIELFNAGVAGEGTTGALERIDTEIRRYEPDLILLLEGVLEANKESPDFDTVEANLAEMIRIAQLRQVAVIVGTIPLLNPEGFRTRGSANIPRLNEIIREEAEAKGVLIAEHEEAFGNDFGGMGPDGLHPNALGYEIMAQTWFDVILIMIQP